VNKKNMLLKAKHLIYLFLYVVKFVIKRLVNGRNALNHNVVV